MLPWKIDYLDDKVEEGLKNGMIIIIKYYIITFVFVEGESPEFISSQHYKFTK